MPSHFTHPATTESSALAHRSRPAPAVRLFWLAAWLLSLLMFTPAYRAALKPPKGVIFDFFKEWAAIQNWREGMPLYTPQRTAIRVHLGQDLKDEDGFFDPYNTHPPTANLIALPFGWMSYRNAHLGWNLISLGMLGVSIIWIVRELNFQIGGTELLAATTLLLASDPLLQSLIQGQPNLLLGLLLVAAWRLDRCSRPWLSGVCLGLAASIKIYPAFVFLYPLVRGNWRAIAGGAASTLIITAMTAAVLGPQTYSDYLTTVLPQLRHVTNNWGNSSLLAFWQRLFGDPAATVRPLYTSSPILSGCLWTSWAVVTGLSARHCFRSITRADRDAAFGSVIVAMLLISPTTWHHYFVLTAIPVAVAFRHTRPGTPERALLWAAVAALTVAPRLIWHLVIDGTASKGVAVPWQSLTALSYQMYALVLLLVMLRPNRTLEQPVTSADIQETPSV